MLLDKDTYLHYRRTVLRLPVVQEKVMHEMLENFV